MRPGRSSPRDWPTPLRALPAGSFDLLRVPLIGRFLRWRHSRRVLQLPLLLLALLMIFHGLFGPRLAPQNLATLLTWVHYRGALVLALLVAGNLFCMACPFMLPRDLARRIATPRRDWPIWLRGKWLSLGLLVAVLFAYEAFGLWGSPRLTALLIVAYFAGAIVVDATFRHAPFCKHVCPIGQFNFVASTVSPLEVRIADPLACARCETLDCIRGTRHAESPGKIEQRGCELALFQPLKQGNMDCTFCLDCVYACPHENVAIAARLPGSELWANPRRSGVGHFSRRPDLGALALLFTFGALLNAFAMVSPVHALQTWLGELMGTRSDIAIMGALFALALVIEPVLLVGLAAEATRRATGSAAGLLSTATRFSYALVPLGLGLWVAHYGFHFLTGLWTFVPVTQKALSDLGLPWLGPPVWSLTGLPVDLVMPLETGFVALGLCGSLLVAWQIAGRDYAGQRVAAFLPWAFLCVLLWAVATWLMTQPMEMRGTVMGS